MASNAPERPVIIRRIRKVPRPRHHGGAWKVAYADFVTAMMAFFMLLWLVSNPDKELLEGLADYFTPAEPAIGEVTGMTATAAGAANAGHSRRSQSSRQEATGVQAMEAGTVGASRGGSANIPDSSLRMLAQELRVDLDSMRKKDEPTQPVTIEQNADSLTISLMDSTRRSMFAQGTATLNPFASTLLTRIARKIAGSGVLVGIEGHTDAAGGLSDANWKLSGERAHSARRAMIAAGLAPERFTRIMALAGTRPVYPDQPFRPENRRIVIVLQPSGSALPPDTSFRF